MTGKSYTFGKLNKYNGPLSIPFSVPFVIIGLFYLVDFILRLRDAMQIGSPISYSSFWNFVGFAVWSPFFFVFMGHIYPELQMSDSGLQTTFLSKKIQIDWRDIEAIKPSRPFGFRIGKKGSVLVVRNGLTSFHKIYGIIYGQVNQPSLLIMSFIKDYDSLMRNISAKVKSAHIPAKSERPSPKLAKVDPAVHASPARNQKGNPRKSVKSAAKKL